jgi:2-polyprenyl-6-hydroxyphenyl methylase/3-demethylubiquinone-9 3-methyltransferase
MPRSRDFPRIAEEWWNPSGKFRPLHKFNPVRLAYIKQQVCRPSSAATRSPPTPSRGCRFLDIGCGGGLLSEPMARLGAARCRRRPVGEVNIEIAKGFICQTSGLDIDYRADHRRGPRRRGRDLRRGAQHGGRRARRPTCRFILDATAQHGPKPGGLMFIATINRTLKAYALAIVGAEYVLRWLPRGTHSYDKLVKPAETRRPAAPPPA